MSKTTDSFIIAQMTDLHIGFGGKTDAGPNSHRVEKVIHALNTMILKPDIVILTGDLVEGGEDWAYEKLKSNLKALNCPVYFAVGNHDNRQAFMQTFPYTEINEGFIQYVIEDFPMRIIVLDTLKEGFHGGGFCQKRKKWLEQTLAQQPERPTLIAMHHPPIDTGIDWMTAREHAPWVLSFRETIKNHDNIVHIIAGHIHRTIFQRLENTTISVCDAVAPEVKLELAPIDPDTPDNRTLISNSEPGYNLHYWNGKTLTSHAAIASSAQALVKFDAEHSFIIRKTIEEL